MKTFGARHGRVAVLLAAAAAAGCAGFVAGEPPSSRRVTVIGVQPRAQMIAGTDVHCIDTGAAGPTGANDEWAVVKYRVGRSPYIQAFAVPAGHTLHKGDIVVVQPSLCTLKDDLPAP